jgi:hypothetical protein
MNKGTKVLEILNGKTELQKLDGFALLKDTWITEFDKKLYNQDGVEYSVLEHYVLEREAKPNPHVIRQKPIINKFSCVLLDKPIEVGDVLYIKY